MNRISSFVFITFFTFLCCCRSSFPGYIPDEKQSLINDIRSKVAIQIKKNTGLSPCGFGGQAMDEVKMLALSFQYYQDVDVDKGRQLLISSVDTFLSAINKDDRIHPYLVNYPFKAKNIEITIYLKSPDRRKVQPGKLCVIEARNGMLIYDIDNPKTNLFQTVYKETYEEALEKLTQI